MTEPGTTMETPAFSLREEDFVTLLVGPNEHKFVVHECCIARNSDFFKAALKKERAEGQERIVKLPEESCVESFAKYLNFAYREKLPTESIKLRADESFTDNPYGELGRIYVIGERMLDKAVQNAVVREFIRLTTIRSTSHGREIPGRLCIARIYNETTAEYPMRRMMVDFYVTPGGVGLHYKGHHPEFLEDLAEELQNKIIAQKAVRDFRGRNLVAENYFV